MVGMIFAAGLGTRLKPLTDTMPKALVPLAGKSLLQWQVEKMRDAGIEQIVVNVHHFPDMIIEAVRANKGWGCDIRISDERDNLLDTGGGLRKAIMDERLAIHDKPVMVCNVDILSNIDLRDLQRRYEQTGISQLVVSERKTQRYLCFDEKNMLQGWTNIATGEVKPADIGSRLSDYRKLAFSGIQILHPDTLALLRQRQDDKFPLISFYLDIMRSIPLQAYIPENYRMMDVGKIDQIEEAERFAESL